MHKKPPVRASNKQIYLDKENNLKVMCLIDNRALFCHRRQIVLYNELALV